MSLRKIANALGVSHAFLSQIRNGKRPMPEDLKDKLEGINAYHLVMNGKQNKKTQSRGMASQWSGRPDSNRRHPAWKAFRRKRCATKLASRPNTVQLSCLHY